MKLGRDTGSLVNYVYGNRGAPEPEIGMGVTFLHWSDRSAGTIVEILPNGYIGVKGDKARRIDNNGMSEAQEYEYFPNPEAPTLYYRLNKTGRWEAVRMNQHTGRWKKSDNYQIVLGHRDAYYDFSF